MPIWEIAEAIAFGIMALFIFKDKRQSYLKVGDKKRVERVDVEYKTILHDGLRWMWTVDNVSRSDQSKQLANSDDASK